MALMFGQKPAFYFIFSQVQIFSVKLHIPKLNQLFLVLKHVAFLHPAVTFIDVSTNTMASVHSVIKLLFSSNLHLKKYRYVFFFLKIS